MRHLHLLLAMALFMGQPVAKSELAMPAGSATTSFRSPEDYVVGISPFLEATNKDQVFRGLVRLIVENLPLNSKLKIFDAYNLQSIAQISIPDAKVFNSAKTRANQFAQAIGQIREFLARDHSNPAGLPAGFSGVIRLPQFCDFLNQVRTSRSRDSRVPLLLIGSPIYLDPKETNFSMADGYFPSDGNLRATRDESVFGFNPGEGAASRFSVCWAFFGDPWLSELHREKVERFWALYLERRGGRLASFNSDLVTALGNFSNGVEGVTAATKGWVADPAQSRPEMLRAIRNIAQADWITADAIPDSTPPPPSRMTGPLKIGIRWKPNIDLDLYASPRPDAQPLFFQHRRSAEGYYFKDQRSSPGRDYEYIEFESPVDVREVQSFVNFYGGSCPGGPNGEVRIEFLNRIYQGTFSIMATEGNQGRSGHSQGRFWTQIPITEILGIRGATPMAANGGG